VDYDASEDDLDGRITEYFNGVWDIFGGKYTIGVYGSFRVCEHAKGHWPGVPFRWQTRAWSGGAFSSGAHLYQDGYEEVCGVQCDVNDAYENPAWRIDTLGEQPVTDAEFLEKYQRLLAPALEAEIQQRASDAVQASIKAIATKLAQ
jgi:hypothetical protein